MKIDKKIHHKPKVIIMALLWVLLLPILTQASPRRDKPEEEEVRETVKMWMLYKLKDEVQLDTDKAIEIFDIIENLEKARRDYHDFERASLQRFNVMVEQKMDKPELYEKTLKELQTKKKAIYDLSVQTDAQLAKLLTPYQQAKVLLLMHTLQRKIRRIVTMLERQKRHNRRFKGSMKGRRGPGPQDDTF